MEPLVEVNSEGELDRALAAGARLIGVNNRNLHTFQVDLGTTARVAQVRLGSMFYLIHSQRIQFSHIGHSILSGVHTSSEF
jgi:indole-3-glycerol phosphate synthase